MENFSSTSPEPNATGKKKMSKNLKIGLIMSAIMVFLLIIIGIASNSGTDSTVTESAVTEENAEKTTPPAEDLNSTGIWRVGHYIDEFGEPTKEGYVTNTDYIIGVFSNTATENSDLNVKFLITNSSEIAIQLYEYADDNPVKAYSSDSYRVLLQDKDKNRFELTATNYNDRLTFDNKASEKVHAVLLKGGKIMFRIIDIETPTTVYSFTIDNAYQYDKAYKLLTTP